MPAGQGFAPPLWAIFLVPALLALAIRLLFLHELWDEFPFYRSTTPGFDQDTYNTWAREIAEGDWLSRKRGVFYYAPLYPYLLAIAYAIAGAGSIQAGLALNLVFGVIGTIAAAGLGRRLFGARGGLAAGILMALSGAQIAYEGVLLNDSVLTGIILMGLWLIFEMVEPGSLVKRCALGLPAGLLLGLAVAGRASNVLPVLAFLGTFAVSAALRMKGKDAATKRREALVFAIPVLLLLFGAGLPSATLIMRNGTMYQRWTMTTNGPINFYMGNAPGASGVFGYPPGYPAALDEINKLPESEQGAAWRARLRRELAESPGALSRVIMKKTMLFLNSWDAPDNLNIYFLRTKLFSMKLTLGPYMIYLFGFIGLIATAGQWRRLLPLYLFSMGLGASLIAVFVAGRFKLPFLGILAVLAGGGASAMLSAFRERRWTRTGAIAAATLASLIFFYPRPVPPEAYRGLLRPNEHIQNARALAQAERNNDALTLCEEGAMMFPLTPFFREALAKQQYDVADWNGVLVQTEPALASGGVSQGIVEMHVGALLKLKRLDEAGAIAKQTLRYFPKSEILQRLAGEKQ